MQDFRTCIHTQRCLESNGNYYTLCKSPSLPKSFTGSRKAQELNYLTRSRRPWSSSLLCLRFLCHFNRSISFFRPQFPTGKMQVLALPWRVLCSQIVKNDGDGAKQIHHRNKIMWTCTFSRSGIERCCLLCMTKYSHPPAAYNNIAKAEQR